jgi:hypothetical protein
MAKLIFVTHKDKLSRFNFNKVDRAKLYGRRVRQAMDPEDKPCANARLTDDGSLLLRPGMLAQGYLDESWNLIERKELVGINEEGEEVDQVLSTLGEEQVLEGPVDPTEVLDINIASVYQLEEVEFDEDLKLDLVEGKMFRFNFNYTSSRFVQGRAYLLSNQEGIFALTGDAYESEWCELEKVAIDAVADDDIGELDFEMF